jgi:CHASE1-domain containing sensor protein
MRLIRTSSQYLPGRSPRATTTRCGSSGPRVTRDERAAFERQARAAGFNDFHITTWAPADPMAISPPRDEYFPILYSTVASKRTATFGTDLNSESIRSDAIRRARDSDKIATAQGIMLRNQISGSREGFLAVIPAPARTAA